MATDKSLQSWYERGQRDGYSNGVDRGYREGFKAAKHAADGHRLIMQDELNALYEVSGDLFKKCLDKIYGDGLYLAEVKSILKELVPKAGDKINIDVLLDNFDDYADDGLVER